MLALLSFFSLRYATKHPIRIFLSAMAVALGVALYVSSYTSNYSTEQAFQSSNERLRGEAQLQVVRGRMIGIEEEVLAKLDATPGVKAAPILQLSSTLPSFENEGTMMVLGVDFKREAQFRRWDVAEGEKPEVNMMAFVMGNGIIVTRNFADRHQLKLGSTFPMDTPTGEQKVTVASIVSDEGPAQVFGGNIGIMDVHTAQKLFKREGDFDRVEVIVDGDVPTVQAALSKALGSEIIVEPPPQKNAILDDAMGRIKALMGISVVALMVAIFIIYNSVSISVVERVKEIGTLRAVGATRAQIFSAVLIEWAVVGVVGSAMGVAGGYALARALIGLAVKEVNNMIPIVVVKEVVLPGSVLGWSLLLGIGTTLLAAWFPARAAMQVSPIELLRQGLYRIKLATNYLRQFWIGSALMLISIVGFAGFFNFAGGGLFSAILGFLGASFILPQMTLWIAATSRPMLRYYRIEAFMAADNTSKFPQRTALTVIALAGALAMMVSAASIVLSFKVQADTWLQHTLPFDLSINANNMNNALFSTASFPQELMPEVDKIESVDFTYGVRAAFQDYAGATVMMIAPDLVNFDRMHREKNNEAFIAAESMPALLAGTGVGISKNFAAIHKVKEGDTITLATLHGPKQFKILRSIEDYSWPQGAIFIERAIFSKYWDDTGLSYLDIKFKPGTDRAKAKHEIAEKIKGRYSLFLYDVDDIVEFGRSALDQTLKFTNVQVGVAVIIGFLGIVNTLLISVMQRMREIGLLRAVGMTRRQVVIMVVIESVFLATLAAIIGVLLGLMGAKWPLAFHVFQITGYLIPFTIPWGTVAFALIASVIIGLTASFMPARHASGVNVLEAIGYE